MEPIKRKRRRCLTKGNRICNVCDKEMAATPENFVRDSSRIYGVGYECLDCHSDRRKGRDRSKELVGNLTAEQKEKFNARALRYSRSPKGLENSKRNRGGSLASSYRQIDERKGHSNDITGPWLENNIFNKACYYCETVDANIGCDRIDNTKGHLMDNVLPCCHICNSARGNRLSVEEMKIVGASVKQIRSLRKNQG